MNLLTSKPSALCMSSVQTPGTRNQDSCSVFTQLDLARCENYHMFHSQERKLLGLSWGWPFGLDELFIEPLSLEDLNIQANFPASLAKGGGGWGCLRRYVYNKSGVSRSVVSDFLRPRGL